MVHGQPLSDDLWRVILNMSRSMDIPNIIHYTGCRKRTIKPVLSDYRKWGTVMQEHLTKELQGAKHVLTAADVQVCLTYDDLFHNHDMLIIPSFCKEWFITTQKST
jgi:hypothetical protein